MIIADYHTHTHFSSDSKTHPEAQIQSAVKKGLSYLCFTDHEDMDYCFPDEFQLDIPAYTSYMENLRNIYEKQIQIGIGIEIGLQPHLSKRLSDFVSTYPFDFIIGSSHVVQHMDPYFPEFWNGRSEKESILSYYEDTLENIKRFDCFDVYGHIDYIIRYRPDKTKPYNYTDYADILDEILKTLIQKGKGIECNTAGFKYGLSQPNPERALLTRYKELGGEILTIGSDAHEPAHIAYDFEKLPSLLKTCGFDYYTIFHNRNPEFLSL
ncbi:Histidinol-phosphatase [Clostridiales bacterium CHKCI001]|nr:Histidinol-phosphatase [Clostridiales bacterium CHKCI001]